MLPAAAKIFRIGAHLQLPLLRGLNQRVHFSQHRVNFAFHVAERIRQPADFIPLADGDVAAEITVGNAVRNRDDMIEGIRNRAGNHKNNADDDDEGDHANRRADRRQILRAFDDLLHRHVD